MSQAYESVDLVDDRTVEYFTVAIVVTALTAVFAQVTTPYPFSPAPFTLQTAGVLLAGLLLGPRWGAFSLVLYLLVGIAGAPVFAGGGSSFGVITGATGGFLLSFPIAAAAVGAIAHRQLDPRPLDEIGIEFQILAVVVGVLIILAIGPLGIARASGLSLTEAYVESGLVFLPGDLVKAAAVIALARGGYLAQATVFDE